MHLVKRVALTALIGVAGVVGQGAISTHAAGQSLAKGWNELGVPTTYYSSASVMAQDLQSQNSGLTVKLLATYSNGHYSLYIPGYSADFALSVGEGVFAYTDASGSWTPQGTASGPVQLTVKAGWNLLSIPNPASIDASTICGELNTAGLGCLAVAHFNGIGTTQAWQFYSVAGGLNFTVNPAEGIFIFTQHAGSWTPS